MNIPRPAEWLIRLAVALALPTLACTAWYAGDALAPEQRGWQPALTLAFPVLLMALAAFVVELVSPKRSNRKLAVLAAFVVLPVILLLVFIQHN